MSRMKIKKASFATKSKYEAPKQKKTKKKIWQQLTIEIEQKHKSYHTHIHSTYTYTHTQTYNLVSLQISLKDGAFVSKIRWHDT